MAKKRKAAKAARTKSGATKKAKRTKSPAARKRVAIKNLAAPDKGKTKRATALGVRRRVMV